MNYFVGFLAGLVLLLLVVQLVLDIAQLVLGKLGSYLAWLTFNCAAAFYLHFRSAPTVITLFMGCVIALWLLMVWHECWKEDIVREQTQQKAHANP